MTPPHRSPDANPRRQRNVARLCRSEARALSRILLAEVLAATRAPQSTASACRRDPRLRLRRAALALSSMLSGFPEPERELGTPREEVRRVENHLQACARDGLVSRPQAEQLLAVSRELDQALAC